MAVLIPVCGVVVMFIQKFYLRTSRQLRLLDLEAKSPLYSNFIESLSGLVTIRAFKWQEHFKARNLELLDTSQVPNYLLFCIQRWLQLVLDLVVAAIAVVLVVLAVKLKGQISGGSIGVALVNITTFNVAIVALIRFWTAMETSLGAVARVKQFASQTASEVRVTRSQALPQDWPRQGAIEFDGVTAFHT
jgi:ATP-binding cassette subfamily C (CFTR/MRP) protein 1